MEQLPSDILSLLTAEPTAVTPLSGSGSNRHYWRLSFASRPDLIATRGTNLAENEAFIYLAEKLGGAGVSVPRVLGVSADRMAYVQTDVGNRSLFECLDNEELIGKAIDLLALAQQTPDIDYSRCYPIAEMNRRAIMWDLNYFKYCFLKTCPELEIDEPALEDEFELLTDRIVQTEPRGFMVRDFQSRNVMTDGRSVSLIDFQGGRLGPAHYDVASFLWQARAGFSADLRSRMISRFCAARGLDEERFRSELPRFVVLRLMQALGAYGLRGRFERKEHFLKSIPAAVASLAAELSALGDYPYLERITNREVERCIAAPIGVR